MEAGSLGWGRGLAGAVEQQAERAGVRRALTMVTSAIDVIASPSSSDERFRSVSAIPCTTLAASPCFSMEVVRRLRNPFELTIRLKGRGGGVPGGLGGCGGRQGHARGLGRALLGWLGRTG